VFFRAWYLRVIAQSMCGHRLLLASETTTNLLRILLLRLDLSPPSPFLQSDPVSSLSSSIPLLFIKGESESGLRVVSVEAYATAPRPSVTDDLSALLKNNNNIGHGNIDNIATKSSEDQLRWVVFFSPSGANAALPTLRKRNNRASQTHAHSHAHGHVCTDDDELIRFAVIGPTTRDISSASSTLPCMQ
jgi:hypothetical protein